jgi:DNA-binding CsgD family transcriptional regulator/tetratricopeptide (TPR) repeat protein
MFAATGGNPFFVTELLRHPVGEVPRSVQDLVLARFARLGKPAQAIVRLAALVPGRIERWLLDTLLGPALQDLEECLDSGLLLAEASSLAFRHELARRAVESAIPLPVAQALHAQLLAALMSSARRLPFARLAHHAAAAGDAKATCRHSSAAAEEALQRGAYREAARHYRSALDHVEGVEGVDDERQSVLLEGHAEACRRIDALPEAIGARERLEVLYVRRGDMLGAGRNLCQLAILCVLMTRNPEADDASRRAIDLLEALPPGPERIDAYDTEASLRMLNRDCEASVAWCRKAIALATELGDRPRLCSSLSVLGTALMFIDYSAGCRQVEEALQMALAEGFAVTAANSMLNLGSASGELMQLEVAERWLRRAVEFTTEQELDAGRHYSNAWLALCEVHTGRWAEAAEHASGLVARTTISAVARVMALVALGRLRVRRGDPGADAALDEALALAGVSGTLQRIAPVRAARAEAAHARGDFVKAAAEAQAALALAERHRHAWFIGELAFWCWRAGVLDTPPEGCAEPYALQIAGLWREAASAWGRLGCPYEQARALADGDADAQREALVVFDRLGARPAAEQLRRRLRASGIRGVARGARRSTRERPHGLTTRELQVLTLLCEGLRNAAIAERLSRSVRTVDHHVASVFTKLGVESRVAAIQAAQRVGLVPQSGQAPASN